MTQNRQFFWVNLWAVVFDGLRVPSNWPNRSSLSRGDRDLRLGQLSCHWDRTKQSKQAKQARQRNAQKPIKKQPTT